tara:strand:- start:1023 stop:1436 length:414 start_codon:yes stop_codon:yes gene_type:complete
MREYKFIFIMLLLIFWNGPILAAESSTKVFIIQPKNGETVEKTFEVVFGIKGMALAPAGTYENNTGHHHLIIDAELPALSLPIPASENYVHFGKGQDRTVLTLEPGKHSLQLLLGDGNHVPHQPPLASKKIEVIVKP